MSTWTNILDLVYPVGSFYQSYKSTSPATLFGGTWTAVTGRFLYANASVATGGANTVTLTVDQMPKHSHSTNNGANWVVEVSAGGNSGYVKYPGDETKGKWTENSSPSRGGGKAHNNMPAYQSCYTWHRTA